MHEENCKWRNQTAPREEAQENKNTGLATAKSASYMKNIALACMQRLTERTTCTTTSTREKKINLTERLTHRCTLMNTRLDTSNAEGRMKQSRYPTGTFSPTQMRPLSEKYLPTVIPARRSRLGVEAECYKQKSNGDKIDIF